MFIRKKQSEIADRPWDKLFPSVSTRDISLAKRMTVDCVLFGKKMLETRIVPVNSHLANIESMVMAKMAYYRLITDSPIPHHLFYGFLHTHYTNHCGGDADTASLFISKAIASERNQILWYFLKEKEERMASAIEIFYDNISSLAEKEGVAVIPFEEFSVRVGESIRDLYANFLRTFPSQD